MERFQGADWQSGRGMCAQSLWTLKGHLQGLPRGRAQWPNRISQSLSPVGPNRAEMSLAPFLVRPSVAEILVTVTLIPISQLLQEETWRPQLSNFPRAWWWGGSSWNHFSLFGSRRNPRRLSSWHLKQMWLANRWLIHFFLFFFGYAAWHVGSLRDLSSLTRDPTRTPCSGSSES